MIDKKTELLKEQLARYQKLPLPQKVALSKMRITQWYHKYRGKMYVSFSGGKDSTVLLHLVRSVFPETPAVFCNTGLEYPEIVDFVKNSQNVTIIRPKLSFKQVLDKYGYPVVSKETAQKIYEIRNTKSEQLRNKRLYGDNASNGKLPDKWKYLIDAPFKIGHQCCHWLKKEPLKRYEKETGHKTIVGTLASESGLRTTNYIRYGCNAYNSPRPMSTPIAFWKDDDIYAYISEMDIQISDIYDKEQSTGCMFCMFGIQFKDYRGARRFDRMRTSHPKQYKYCMEKLGLKEVIEYVQSGGNHDKERELPGMDI